MALALGASSSHVLSIPRSGITFISSWPPSSSRISSTDGSNGARILTARVISCGTRFTTLATVDKKSLESIQDEDKVRDEFVEVGVVIRKHGVRGELLIRSSTDFPQERFEKPGKRWMKISERGEETIECVDLVSGRNRAGKLPCWLLTLKNVDSVEKASKYIGATMLVKRDERPALEEGEFYIPDLIGMDVFVQSSMENIGTIADMCNFGASDLLRVQRNPASSVGEGPLIWIPFVEAIVPVVDMEQRRVIVDPPEGLLELNTPAKRKEKAEARKEEVKAMRKLQMRKSGLKKSLIKSKQDHLLAGLSVGEQEERDSLLKELLNIDFKALQVSFVKACERSKTNECRLSGFTKLPEIPSVSKQELERWMKEGTHTGDGETNSGKGYWKRGLDVIASNRVAVASLIRPNDDGDQKLDKQKSRLQLLAQHLRAIENLATLEFPGDVCQIPWFICTSSDLIEPIRSLLDEEEFFGLQSTQVCVITVETVPCFDTNNVAGDHQILRMSPWKLLQSVTGDGGVLKTLAIEGLISEFAEKGLDYLQVLDDPTSQARIADPFLFGYAEAQASELTIQTVEWQPSMDVIGFRELQNENSLSYELVRRYACKDNKDLELCSAVSPLGSYILSVSFAKKLHDSGFNFELHSTSPSTRTFPVYREKDGKCELVKDSSAMVLESSLLDCIVKCEPRKISIVKLV
ncbi:uncharacterized protein LOC112351348 [Selaginella moellendorffii]|uniref:uncharacterized protein LOC112351348 n=1 Tax=Selaginella moellendorffii TaxID=88036 RepID=UPI000D1C904A|nr:uncharacterized protein LOC112351348 [Selaginella moellendorffii]|eukprot:XP_024544797.1 uncharacterized protein LOC112351348 [Selaginella moellendorffii]